MSLRHPVVNASHEPKSYVLSDRVMSHVISEGVMFHFPVLVREAASRGQRASKTRESCHI